MRVIGVVGNPSTPSRTGVLVSSALHGCSSAPTEDALIDLAPLGPELLARGPAAREAVERVKAADLVIIGSPVYKASYTGLLKLFLDLFNAGDLAGKVALPLMVGGSELHSLALPCHLIPVLAELGAISVPGGYFIESTIDKPNRTLNADAAQALAALLRIAVSHANAAAVGAP